MVDVMTRLTLTLFVALFCSLIAQAQTVSPSPLCNAQNLCTCWTNATATQPPACYNPSIYTCVGGTVLRAGVEATCSVGSPGVASPSPAPRPSASPSPTPPPAGQLLPSPLCEAQGLCTCWNNATAAQLPACYSPSIYTCPGGTFLRAGPEVTCSVSRIISSPAPASPRPALPSPSPAPRPSPSPAVAPPPSPGPGRPLAPFPMCDAQNLCTCWTNATATQPPACYNPSIYTCVAGTVLIAGSEATCSVSRVTSSPAPSSPRPVLPSPSPNPGAQEQVLFLDDFSSLDRTSWTIDLGDGSDYGIPGWGNNELQCYTESNVAIVPNPDRPGDGLLRIRSIYSPTPQACINRYKPASSKQWTSGKLTTSGKRTFMYSTDGQTCVPVSLESRIKFASKQGHWEAFWALGVSGAWPKSGEIDVVEHVNRDASVLGTLHYANPSGGHEQQPPANRIQLPSAVDGWNVYRVDWSCDSIRWFVNGEQKLQVNRAQVNVWAFDQPFYLLLNMAVGGNLPGWNVDTSGGDMLVDYVKVYYTLPVTPPLVPSPSPSPVPTPTSPSPVPVPAPPSPSPGNPQPQLLFLDDFSSLDRTSWTIDLGDGSDYGIPGWGNNELQCYTESNVAIVPNPDRPGDGLLRIRSIYSPTPQACINRYKPASSKQWTSGKLTTSGKRTFGPQQNGPACTTVSLESRIKFASKQGHWEAFWALGVSGAWPKSGEIDVVEHVNRDASVLGTLHYANPSGGHEQQPLANRIQLPSAVDGWNTYRVDWSCDSIRWFVNGEQKLQVNRAQVNVWAFDQPFYLLLNMAIGGNLPGWNVDTSGGDMLVDYVKVYSTV